MAAKPIVAGTDGFEESLRATDQAAREAAFRSVPLRIVAAAALLPRMVSRRAPTEYETVTDVLVYVITHWPQRPNGQPRRLTTCSSTPTS